MKRDNRILIIIVASVMLGATLVTACTNKAKEQSGDKPSAGTTKGKEQPIPLQPTKENKGRRCERKIYYGVGPEAAAERECYRLQKRLIDASENGDLTQIKEALKYGANVEGAIGQSFLALHTAAMAGHAEAVVLLLDNGAQVNLVADFQNAPLGMAAAEGHLDVVKVLIERGADVCYRTSAGTAEDIARARGYTDISDVLKAARQNADCPDAKSEKN